MKKTNIEKGLWHCNCKNKKLIHEELNKKEYYCDECDSFTTIDKKGRTIYIMRGVL